MGGNFLRSGGRIVGNEGMRLSLGNGGEWKMVLSCLCFLSVSYHPTQL